MVAARVRWREVSRCRAGVRVRACVCSCARAARVRLRTASEEMVISLTSLSKCSTPTSSDSMAPISDMTCLKVHDCCCPSRISSTAWYASVGIPSAFGFTSMITMMGLGVYRRTRASICRSPGLILGPVEYQPTSFSEALTFLNMANICSWYEWSRYQIFRSRSSSSKGTA